VLPDAQELQLADGYSKDAVGDLEATVLPGLIHKYHGRVLLTLTGACAIHCRYYLHRLDKVQGAAHFDISKQEVCVIYGQLRSRLPGYLLPALVEEIPGHLSKTPVYRD
jgi:L-lysine 2,3-aminomutase